MKKEETTDPRDRRAEELRAPVEIKVDLSALGNYHLTKIMNISTGGAFICHEDIHPIGTIVTISFTLPSDKKPIETEAQVCWSYKQAGRSRPSSTGMGVKFLKIKPSDQKRIETYISDLLLIEPKKKR